MEEWKTIQECETYAVSNLGRVKNQATGKLLKPVKNSNGYYKVQLKKKQYDVHRLVAKYFIPNPENLPQVNHKNEDKSMNEWWNLEWVSASRNMSHGTRGKRAVENGSGIEKKIYQYQDGELVGVWRSQKFASDVFDIKQACISRSVKGIYKSAGGYTWSYELIPE